MSTPHSLIRAVIGDLMKSPALLPKRKMGRKFLQPYLVRVLNEVGLEADAEDSLAFLPSGLHVWRNKATGEIEPTTTRRLIDVVVRSSGNVVALMETESDLDHLRETGVSKRGDGYDVYSIAMQSNGAFFNSYRSLERMASAAFYHARISELGANPGPAALSEMLANVRSNKRDDHNPFAVPMFLVTGRAREMDRRILSERLESLGAELCSP